LVSNDTKWIGLFRCSQLKGLVARGSGVSVDGAIRLCWRQEDSEFEGALLEPRAGARRASTPPCSSWPFLLVLGSRARDNRAGRHSPRFSSRTSVSQSVGSLLGARRERARTLLGRRSRQRASAAVCSAGGGAPTAQDRTGVARPSLRRA
jgi:hypothetical protein